MEAPNFNFKLDVRCEEIETGNFQYEGKSTEDTEEVEIEASEA